MGKGGGVDRWDSNSIWSSVWLWNRMLEQWKVAD